jgi:uncharacterized membrane protein YcaP (DUF421 family)
MDRLVLQVAQVSQVDLVDLAAAEINGTIMVQARADLELTDKEMQAAMAKPQSNMVQVEVGAVRELRDKVGYLAVHL